MCGIFSVVQINRRIWSREVLQRATDTLSHRGPDECGFWEDDGVFLGHRRLKIIDLETGAQPMSSHDSRYVITFNGEIYNYRELRDRLMKSGHQFITASDTEVIIEAYRCWGENCITHLNGMFAFVLWDRREKCLFAARDRLGIKPLCWMTYQGNMLFASTLEPFYHLPDLPRVLNYEALRDVLAYGYIPATNTILIDIHKLRPGHCLNWRKDKRVHDVKAYWEVPSPGKGNSDLDGTEILEKVEVLSEQAVSRQMVSDVPLGVFLSGGIDSSLLVAFMQRRNTSRLKTFSIGFHGSEYDESKYAKEVADHFGTEHTVLSAEDISSEQLLNFIGNLDEPFADPAIVPTILLSGLTRQYVKVVLSGDGADEVFGGYPKFLSGEDVLQNPWYPWTRPLKWLLDTIPVRPRGISPFYWRTLTQHERISYGTVTYGDFPVFRKDLKLVLSDEAYTKICASDYFYSWSQHAHKWDKNYTTDLLMRTDLQTYLSENCLVKTDRASMMNSLEVRVPFLDENLLDFVLSLHADCKIVNGQLKYILLLLAKKYLPRSVWDRPKHGFTVPLGKNMAINWSAQINVLLDWGNANLPLFNYTYLHKLVSINKRSHSVGRALWTPLVVLMWWYKQKDKITL